MLPKIWPIAIEQGYMIHWKRDDVLPFLGYADVIERLTTGDVAILDFKTSSMAKTQDDIDLNNALTAYALGYELATGEPCRKVRYAGYTRSKEPSIEFLESTRTEDDFVRLFAIAKTMTSELAAGNYLPQDDPKKCPSCYARERCRAMFSSPAIIAPAA